MPKESLWTKMGFLPQVITFLETVVVRLFPQIFFPKLDKCCSDLCYLSILLARPLFFQRSCPALISARKTSCFLLSTNWIYLNQFYLGIFWRTSIFVFVLILFHLLYLITHYGKTKKIEAKRELYATSSENAWVVIA